jgi:hypothetical protein
MYRFVERRQQALIFVRFQNDIGRVPPGTSGFVLAIRSQRVQQSTVPFHRRELVSQTQLVRHTHTHTHTHYTYTLVAFVRFNLLVRSSTGCITTSIAAKKTPANSCCRKSRTTRKWTRTRWARSWRNANSRHPLLTPLPRWSRIRALET